MLYAKLDTPSAYTPLLRHQIWEEALAALRVLNVNSPLGITQLRGKEMFINLHTYETLPVHECRFEGHRDMIDMQYMITGGELVDWVLKEDLQEDGNYLENSDFQYYEAPDFPPTNRVHLKPGYFAVFLPEDGHRPKLSDGVESRVLKAVVKIHRELLD